jgi:hypothetical protein
VSLDGIPLHVLVVHLAVVLTPLTCGAALAWATVPRWRPTLQAPLVIGVVASLAAVWSAYYSGPDYWLQPQFSHASNAQIRLFEEHERDARLLLWSASAFALAILMAVERSEGRTGAALRWVAAGAAFVTLVLVVITGHAGAKAVWAP